MSNTQSSSRLGSEQKQDYKRDGFLILRGVFSEAETQTWQRECERLLALDLIDPLNIRTPFRMESGNAPERIDPVVDISPLFADLVCDERIIGAVRDLFGDEPLLFKDKLILKAPGTNGYTMHQDQAWWQLCPADDILSVSIQIDGSTAQNGCIELFGGYHRTMLTPEGLETNFRAEELAQIDMSRGKKMETQPGDVLIFHSLAPHQSGRNVADVSRRSLYLSYNAARSGDLRGRYYEHYKNRENGDTKYFR